MAKAKKETGADVDPRKGQEEIVTTSVDEEMDEDETNLDLEDRKKNHVGLAKVKSQMADIYKDIVRGFEDKSEQNSVCERAWDMYNCVLNENQAYNGTSTIYVPLVRDAVEARVTRFTNQIFPQSGRYSDVVGTGEIPWDVVAILDHYVNESKLKSIVIPALMREGDCSGQYSVHIEWSESERHTVRKIKKPEDVSELGTAPVGGPEYEDRAFETVKDAKPDVVVLDARNLVVLPATVDEIDDAEVVAIALRLTKARVKKYIRDGVFDKEAGENLLDNFDQVNSGSAQQPDTEKKALNQAGVKTDSSGNKRALVYKAWAKIKVKGEYRLMEMFFAGEDNFLSCRRIPLWSDRVPVISKPSVKVPGSFWGKSPVAAVEKLQYQANDAVNIGMDSAPFSLLPVVMTDPERNPKIGSMIMAQAAIWETNPKDTSILEIPPLWQQAMEIVALCKNQVMQSLGVNPAMMPHANSGKKPSQSQVAQEQQVALESTANVVSLLEEGVLAPILRWFYEMDYQFRERPITIQKFGTMGLQADLQQVPLIADNSHYVFRWNGTEANKSVQQVQQMIAAMNVLRGIPPEQLNGRKLDITPVLEHVASVAFGPRMAPKVIIDQRHQMALDPMTENELMASAFPVPVNPQDNDQEHIMAHQQALAVSPSVFLHQHIAQHVMQMSAKAAKAAGIQPGQQQQGSPGVPGGAGPGVAGTPRVGAQPGMPRMQQPAGAVHQDQMPLGMPRR